MYMNDSRSCGILCLTAGTLLFYSTTSAFSANCLPPAPNLISWWAGDGNVFDIQSGIDGTLQDGATFDTGEVSQAFKFAANGFVDIPYNQLLDPPTGQITVDAWVNPASMSHGAASIINKRTASNNAGYTLEQLFDNSGLVLWVVFVGGSPIDVVSNTALPLTTWTHVAGTYDGTTSKLYFNGALVGSTTSSGPIDASPAAGLQIGKNIVNGALFDGLIDEVEVFDRALAQSEIQAIFNRGGIGKCKPTCAPPPPNMTAWWPGDGDADDIRGSNNGTLENGVTFVPGEVAQAFSLNGSNQFVQVADSPLWAFGTNDFSIDLWINFNSIGAVNGFVGHDEGPGPVNKWFFGTKNGQLFFHINSPEIGNPGLDITSTPPFAPSVGEWHHVAVTKSGIAYTFYVDGSPGTPVSNSTAVADANAPLVIGQTGESSRFINGLIDEVEIFNRALSSAEIQAIYAAGTGGKCKTSPPLKITAVSRPGAGTSSGHFFLNGLTVPGALVTIQAAPNPLTTPTLIGTTTADNTGVFQYDDAGAVALQIRVYRASYP